MNLPEPVAWYYTRDTDAAISFAPDRDTEKYWQKLFTETQMREELTSHEDVMRQVIELLGPQAPECCGCAAEWNEAIKALKDALK